MNLSVGITTHNEHEYIRSLIGRLVNWINLSKELENFNIEIVLVDDNSDEVFKSFLITFAAAFASNVKLHKHSVDGDFGAHKTFLNLKCSGDWILHLDADELISDDLFAFIPMLINDNPEVEAYWIPRVNTVDGLTFKHVQKWGWVITELPGFEKTVPEVSPEEYELLKQFNLIVNTSDDSITYKQPIVCWPDCQMRLYKNSPDLIWKNKVHEQLTGYKTHGVFPIQPEYAIIHHKKIARQERQNNLYEEIQQGL